MQPDKKIKIAVDAMGGDYPPDEVVKGAVAAAQEGMAEIILVGPFPIIEAELLKYSISNLPISIINADEFVSQKRRS